MATNDQNQPLRLQGDRAEGHSHGTYTSISTNMHIALKYGIRLTIYFVVIFIIARVTGLARYTEFRFINYLLFFPVGFAAVRKAYKLNNNYLEYFNGLMIGFLTVM